jgi:succinate dehydrogenase/fumarate reductase flavoprotein subunit
LGITSSSATTPDRIEADVLVVGGGMAAAWAAIGAAREGAEVVLVDKGYVGTSGVTATAGPGHWFIPPDPDKRAAAIATREKIAFGLGDTRWMGRIIDEAYRQLPTLAGHYTFGVNDAGVTLYGAVRGPEYMRALRQLAESLGVRILDQSPALELLLHADGSVAGARGVRRQKNEAYEVRAAGVILATGGTAFFSRLLGSQTNTGDGYLMAVEAGAALSGMEFSSHYTIAPAFSTMARGMSYAFATYYGPDLRELDLPAEAGRNRALARAMLDGPVYCDLAKMPADIRQKLPTISPNVMLPFVRRGIDPFRDKFPVLLLAEGTIRGMGGIQIADDDCQTSVAGLYAAGDAASRELVTGAISGGGSINSAWALSSGTWAGRAAARRAVQIGRRAQARAEPIGSAGLRPTGQAASLDATHLIHAARDETVHYDRNYFRTEEKLTRSLGLLDGMWAEIRSGMTGQGNALVRNREAAAIVASARWSFIAARQRRESRGMHARIDHPTLDPRFERRQLVGGLDQAWSSFAKDPALAELAS